MAVAAVAVEAAEVEAEEEAMGPAECECASSVNSQAIILIAVLKMPPHDDIFQIFVCALAARNIS